MHAVHVQNEPNSCQNFPSCIWTPEALATFIGKYLGPEFEKVGLNTEMEAMTGKPWNIHFH